MTATVTALPLQGTPYVIHTRTMTGEEVTHFLRATSISGARAASGLPTPVVVHPAEDANCDTCDRALAARAVTH